MREVAEMKPIDDDSIKAIVLTGDDMEQLTEHVTYYLCISSSLKFPFLFQTQIARRPICICHRW